MPELSGQYAVGETLSVSLNDWEGRDVSYSWSRDGQLLRDEPPSNTTGNILRTPTYTLTAYDVRSTISVSVSASGENVVLQTSRIASPASLVTDTPSISGTPSVGNTLTASPGTWSDGTQLTYQWLRNRIPISGATSSTYTLQLDDAFSRVSVEVSGSLTGSLPDSRVSAETAEVESTELIAGVPVAGAGLALVVPPSVNCTISAEPGDWEFGTTFEYRWVIGGSEVGDFSNSSSYILTSDDIGKTVAVDVRGSKEGKQSKTVRSAAAGPVVASEINSCVTSEQFNATQAPNMLFSRSYAPQAADKTTVGQYLGVDIGQWPEGTSLDITWRRSIPNSLSTEVISRSVDTLPYQVAAGDVGRSISATVTARQGGKQLRSSTLGPIKVLPELEGERPIISGTPAFGETLTVQTGNWTTSDLSYQWLRNGIQTVSTSTSYTITEADWLSRISVRVTGRVTEGNLSQDLRPALSLESARTDALPLATLASPVRPTVSGVREIGETLTANPGTWTTGTEFSYQWLRDGVELPGATSQTYAAVLEDATKNISVRVTGSQRGYEDKTITSSNLRIQGLTLTAGTPTLSGSAEVGETLTVDPGTWTDGTDITYEWARVGGQVIAGATGSTYVVTLTEVGWQLAVIVRGTKTYYEQTVRITPETQTVPVPDVAGSTPTISGSAAVNETLTAVPGAWTDGTILSYQWIRDGEAITGATAQTYSVAAEDEGSRLSVSVSGSLNGYNSTTLTSASTAPVSLQALASSTPTISGTAEVGQTLTVSTGSWTDGTSFNYQWLRDGREISGASNGTYVVTVLDVGSAISARVTGSKEGFASTTLSSAETAVIPALTLTSSNPTIAGTAEVGQSLEASVTGWTAGTSFDYQWLRDGTAIPGATSSTYVVTIDDVSGELSVSVTGSQVGYTSKGLTSAATTTVPELTLDSATPSISGEAEVGETLTAIPGEWTEGASLGYQWRRDGDAISGASGASYLVAIGDVGSQISVSVTGRKAGYTTKTVNSVATTTVPVPDVQSSLPTISGVLAVGSTLSAIPGDWSEGTAFEYQWRRDGANITGATGASYELTESDLDAQISVRLVGEKLGYNPATRESSSTSAIKRRLDSSRPTISGEARIGSTLTVSTGSWTPGVAFAYQWLRNGTSISGSTSTTYVIGQVDAGATLSVRVTGTLEGYLTESVISPPTAAIPRPGGASRPSRDDETAPLAETSTQNSVLSRPLAQPPAPGGNIGAGLTVGQGSGLPAPAPTALVGGRPVTILSELTSERNLRFTAGRTEVNLTASSEGSSVDEGGTGPTLVTPVGSSTVLNANGLLPGSRVNVVFPFANGLVAELPALSASEDGSLELVLDFSDSVLSRPYPVGNHAVRILGVDANGDSTVIEIPIRIAQSDPTPQLLSSTGEQPSASFGEVTALVAGEPEDIEQETTNNIVDIRGGDWSMELSINTGSDTDDVLTFSSGTPRTILGNGFLAGTRADIWLFSTPQLIGTAEVGEDGLFIADFTVDESVVALGAHTLQIQGVGADGYVRAVNLGVEVANTPEVGSVEETPEGLSLWVLAGVLALLLIGGTLILLGVRRAASSRR